MNKEFIPYEQALELKELGFNEPCFGSHAVWGFMSSNDVNSLSDNVTQEDLDNQAYLEEDGVCLAPLYQQAFKWFREKHDLFGCIDLQACSPSHWFIRIDKIEINDYLYHSEDENVKYNTYEEAELACLRKLIEIVKNK